MVTAKKLVTVDDVMALEDDERAEMHEGEIVRKAAPDFAHGGTQGSILEIIRGRFKGGGRDDGTGGWWLGSEIDTKYDQFTSFRHDVAGWRRDRSPARPSGRPVTLRPDWVCEVLSPSNWRTDTERKRILLHRFEVPHYWIVDTEKQSVTVLRWQAEGYLLLKVAGAGEKARLEPFDAVEFSLDELLGVND